MISHCTCSHAYQDTLYGPQNRVWNPSGKHKDKARCTVCGVFRDIHVESKGKKAAAK